MLAQHNVLAEYESWRLEVATCLRSCVEAQGGKAEDLFEAIAGDGRMLLCKGDIRLYLANCDCPVDEVKLEKIFPAYPDGRKTVPAPTGDKAAVADGKTEDGSDE